ncbi:MAG: NAD kinase [Bacteroidales bacterium]
MKVAVFSKSDVQENRAFFEELIDVLKANNAGIVFYKPLLESLTSRGFDLSPAEWFDDHVSLKEKARLLLSVGGDGTLLDTLLYIRDSGIPVLGINLGRMGFLSSIPRHQISEAIKRVVAGDYELDKRALLHLDTEENPFGELPFAMNELSVYRTSPQSMLRIKVSVNEEFLNYYWADGLIVATPTGSTAYSLSNGGPIILPGSQNFVITPIASHNLTVRPIVIPDDSQIEIQVVGRVRDFYVNLDSRAVRVTSEVMLRVSREKFQMNLIRLKNDSYFRTIREKLMWGLDIRN